MIQSKVIRGSSDSVVVHCSVYFWGGGEVGLETDKAMNIVRGLVVE